MSLALIEEVNPQHEPGKLAAIAPGAIQLMLDLEATGALTPRAMKLPADITWDQYVGICAFWGEVKSRGNFYLGDGLIHGEGTFGERFAQAGEATGLSEQTLLRIMAVCRAIPPSRRNNHLSWSVHTCVMSLSAREQKTWLKRAEDSNWGYAELRKAMQAARHDEKPPLFDDADVDENLLVEAARSLVANAEEAGENVICRREDYARLKAALGEGE